MRPTTSTHLWAVVAAVVAVTLALPGAALGHAERDAEFPDGNGVTPSLLSGGPTLLVCKADSPRLFATLPTSLRQRNEQLHERCMVDGFRHIQQAVDAVTEEDTRILVLPGVYREEPSLAAHKAGCEELDGDSNGDEPGTPSILSYDEQRACPHVQNLIAVFGDSDGDRECDLPQCGLQIEGTGADPTDVIIDGRFEMLNGIRADRVDGVRFHNFTVQRFEFNALYVLETDGFLIDNVLGRWNDEYAYLTFAVDHGLYQDCEGYGNGDSAIYPGSASDLHSDKGPDDEVDRYAVEVVNCDSHHNALGYSGTAGNAVHVRDSDFHHNQTGIATDSLFPNHPGLPQDHAFFDSNRIYANNRAYVDYVHDGTCDAPFIERGYEHGVVCPVIPAPIGAGLLIAGGNHNRIEGNEIYDNWRSGTYQIHVPAALREEPEDEGDTSHYNRYRDNRLGFGPGGTLQPNGVDFWWDDQGEGNCWQDNEAKSGDVTHNAADPRGLPDCDSGGSQFPLGNPFKQSQIASCAGYDRRGSDLEQDPPGCDFFRHPDRPEAREPGQPALRRTKGGGPVTAAVGTSRRAFRDGADAVVVAAKDRRAAALVATPLAGKVKGPLLLTNRKRLSTAVANEVQRLGARRAYVVGAMRPRVLAGLRTAGVRDITVLRGSNRYKTASKVARAMGGLEVYVARGARRKHLTDSFAIAGTAAQMKRPILLSRQDGLPPTTVAALRRLDPVNAVLVGNTGKLSEGVENAVGERVDVVDRLDANKRYAVSAAAAEMAIQGIADESLAWLSHGRSTDTLAAAAAAATEDAVVLMVNGNDLDKSPAARRWLSERRLDLRALRLVGGPARISTGAHDQIAEATAADD